MNQEQQNRSIIISAIKDYVKLDVTPYQHGVLMKALDAWYREPARESQIKFWRFVAFMLTVVALMLTWWLI